MRWFERIFRRRHLYNDLSEEVREHIEEKTEQLMRLENLSPEQARAAALRAFGNPTLVQTRSREVWQWPRLESLLADVKLAFRRLRRSPGFATTGAAHTGDRHRRQYRGPQRGGRCTAQAAQLPAVRSPDGRLVRGSWHQHSQTWDRAIPVFHRPRAEQNPRRYRHGCRGILQHDRWSTARTCAGAPVNGRYPPDSWRAGFRQAVPLGPLDLQLLGPASGV
jgi:hypothetical protein